MKDWCLEIWGDYACFTRPEMKVERVSYDVITPSAARAIFEAVLWKPSIKWNITKIEVLNPIKFVSIRRNEVGKTISPPTARQIRGEVGIPDGIYIEEARQQRASLCLKDVKYRIHGYFDFLPEEGQTKSTETAEAKSDESSVRNDESEEKYAAMFERRASKGQCFHRPYLGTREFSCYFRLVDPEVDPSTPINEYRDLGFMLYDMNFEQNRESPPPLFFRAVMEKGIINTDRRGVQVIG
ncbi:CRISPR-associated protein [uncultured archaeon]|nr:CRISPR-associated protein [uncultured archaeon]HKJ96192.1 type I-C CRISPR-associated protein Cas5c [Thermoplasmataceae archaeon]